MSTVAVHVLETGDPAPDFSLENQEGSIVNRADFDGQYLIVYFYPRADTAGCTTEACGFRDSWNAFEERDVAVVGISDDPVSDLTKFAAKYELPFELLSDESGDVASEYGSYGEKHAFGNTFDGVFRNTFVVNPDGRIERVYEGVSPEGHADEILRDLP